MDHTGRIEEILVPLDGSELSRTALRAAIRVATPFHARIHVIHVVPRLDEYTRYREALASLMDELAGVGKGIVSEGVGMVRAASLPHASAVSSGHPAGEIAMYARARGVDLIILGSRGLNPGSSESLGSVSYQVAMRANCSVLVARDSDPFSRILLAVDGSKDALRAGERVEEIATRLGSKVSLMFVVPARPEGVFTIAQTPADPFLLDIEKRMVARGIVVTRHVKYGHPAEEILKAAERHTLVALGARGRSDLALDYVGGVGDKVLRNAKTSTLIVR